MIYLDNDSLEIRFPEVHENAGIRIDFQRTLRLPDNGESHHLPPGLGRFPIRHIEDFDLGDNNHLKKRGGVVMPMFQADALWLNFGSINVTGEADYPIALKIGTGKICAVSGDDWVTNLNQDPQDYVVVPDQPWIDGYNVGQDIVKQFVAAPLGHGFTVEEQLKSEADTGGIQIQAFPMKREFYDLLNKSLEEETRFEHINYSMSSPSMCMEASADFSMGLAAGGSMQQEIFEDPHNFEAWDLRETSRCFVTIANAEQWIDLTGEEPPISPMSASDYTKAGLPWFNFYGGDKASIKGAKKLGKIKSVNQINSTKRTGFLGLWKKDLPVNNPKVVSLGKRRVHSGNW